METILVTGGGFSELHLDLDEEWETPRADEEPVTVERPYTDLELALIEQMRIERDERRKEEGN